MTEGGAIVLTSSDHQYQLAKGVRITLALVALTLVAVAATMSVGWTDTACSWCHRSQVEAMADNVHAGENCYGCHLEDGAWGLAAQKNAEVFQMYPAALVGRGLVLPARSVSRSNCLRCHKDILSRDSLANGLRIRHSACATDSTCDACHASVAHDDAVRWKRAPVMEECIGCHTAQGASVECESCHVSEKQEARIGGPWQVTHGPSWRETHGMGRQDSCSTCHPADFCARCHRVPVPHPIDFGATHGGFAIDDPGSCETCHHSKKDFCDSCHEIEMPHPTGFLREHGEVASGDDDPLCLRCHVETDCGTCHVYHTHPGGSAGVPVPWPITPEAERP